MQENLQNRLRLRPKPAGSHTA